MMLLDRSGAAAAAAALACVLALSCGGGNTPATSTPPTTTPSPSPTAGTGGGGTSAICSLGKGDVNAVCSSGKGSARLQLYVETAIDQLVREKPQLFDLNAEERPNTDTFRVLDTESYLDNMAINIRRQGACAERDPDDLRSQRILAKDANDFSESFSVLSEKGFIRRGNSAFVETCTPASFPIDRVGDVPPAGSGCHRPYPPPVTRFNVKIHTRSPQSYTIDSTPIVGPDLGYCMSVGYTDGRILCPVRPEGWDDRSACENWRVGTARDTGRGGPTWTNGDGKLCTGPGSNCLNHPDNQYSVIVYNSGVMNACASNGACGSVLVER